MDFNYIDGFVLIALAFSFYKGFSKGFVIVLASFVALILGVIGAIYFSDVVAELLKSKTEINEEYISITAFSITFMGIIFGVHLIAKIVNQAVKMVALGPLNKIMGGVFSMLKTIILLSVTFYIFDFLNTQITIVNKKTLDDSVAYNGIRNITDKVIPLLTDTDWYTSDPVEKAIQKLKNKWEDEYTREVLKIINETKDINKEYDQEKIVLEVNKLKDKYDSDKIINEINNASDSLNEFDYDKLTVKLDSFINEFDENRIKEILEKAEI